MIIENRAIFGKGTVIVGARWGVIELTEIKPPQKVGSIIGRDAVEFVRNVEIFATNSEFDTLLEQLKGLDKAEDKKIIFNGYILDFTDYNFKSIEVLKRGIHEAQGICQRALAC